LPLLTPQEERELASDRISADREISLLEKSLAVAKQRKKPQLSEKLNADLQKQIDRRDGVVCTFMERNLRLAIKVAGDYGFLPMELELRIASATDGLREAALRFDPDRGAKFSSYASHWIRQRILRDAANQGRVIRLPLHMASRLRHVVKAEETLTALYGGRPSDDDIANHLGLSAKQIRDVRLAQETFAVSMEPLPSVLDGMHERDQIPDPKATIPGSEEFSVDRTALLMQALYSLNKRERAVLNARFGLGESGERETLEVVGKRFGVTRERIRQLENIALRKLRKKFDQLDVPLRHKKES
jgi:RNA polymerase primary sigma factor